MTEITPSAPGHRAFLEHSRKDAWWLAPLLTAGGLAAFTVYALWAAWANAHYQWGPYLSPLYAPLLPTDWLPVSLRWISPAFFILWAPLGFRGTCYYYRKAYYRSMFFIPPACAVAGLPIRYRGERGILLFQNLHRYFLYLALGFIVILSYDAILSFIFTGPAGGKTFGIGVGSIVMTLNAVFLAAFTFGCNSLRHLVGGNVDCYSRAPLGATRHRAWQAVTRFNAHHMIWAWISLFWVGFTDLYVRLVSMGVIADLRIL
jgi:hypothetical protein